jgi:hypothetical protein
MIQLTWRYQPMLEPGQLFKRVGVQLRQIVVHGVGVALNSDIITVVLLSSQG